MDSVHETNSYSASTLADPVTAILNSSLDDKIIRAVPIFCLFLA